MAVRDCFRKQIAKGEGERLWQIYGYASPSDLVLEDLAWTRGVIVTEGPMDKMQARLVRRGNTGMIRVKQDIPIPGQRRFALAHELGHWELHSTESQIFACTNDDMVASYRSSILEGEANMFAAGLLMPSSHFLSRAANQVFSLTTIGLLKEYFLTSLTATAIRYVELSDDYCAIVCSEAGRVRWWRGSECFERRFWIQPGSILSSRTVAATLFSVTHDIERCEEVDIDAWSERGFHDGTDTFIEQSKYFQNYSNVLSLLRLL